MADSKDRADLVQIAQAVAALGKQLAEQGEVQKNMLAVLESLLETNQAHSEMIADILGAATQEPGPSPVADALAAVVAQVQLLNENQAAMIAQMAGLPDAIGQQFAASLSGWSGPTAPHE
jgi:hypothetical protein